jgi:hypothetical protein
MFQRLTDGNDSNLIAALRIHQRNDDTLEKTKGDVPQFAVVFARVLDRNQRSIENGRGIPEVNTALGDGLGVAFNPDRPSN